MMQRLINKDLGRELSQKQQQQQQHQEKNKKPTLSATN